MANRRFIFDVKETTTRMAVVDAESADEARAKLNKWAASGGSLDEPEGISMGDMSSEGFTFRNRGSERAS